MTITVHFLPDDRTLETAPGDNLLTAAAEAGVFISASCGGNGVCGKCQVKLLAGRLETTMGQVLARTEQDSTMYLACTSRLVTDCTVRIPPRRQPDGSTAQPGPKTTHAIPAAATAALTGSWQVRPPVRKHYLELPPPTRDDNIADTQRLIRALRPFTANRLEPRYDHPELLRDLPDILREADWRITVILLESLRPGQAERIIAVEQGDTTSHLYGLALDLGTTTMSGILVDLNSGEVLSQASSYNRQARYGEDVISRIVFAARPGGVKSLQNQAVATINEIIMELCRQQRISPSDISYIVAAGNTVMAHLLLGISPRHIREAPYVPTVSEFPLTKAAPLGIMAHPCVRLFLYPCVASYVGGDIVAGIHGCRLHQEEQLTLFIDIGTNGEIVLGNRDWLLCTACSAGPAFEGGGLTWGMRATSGAIENFHLDPVSMEPMIVTVGNQNPVGICGSGLIAIVPELLAAGIINERGRFSTATNHPRVRQGRDGWEFVVVWASESGVGQDIVITEIDLEAILRAKGAMYAGYQTLLDSVGFTFEDLDRVILAGNFGAHIDLERAIAIGLLPDLERDRFFYLGNASLLGCQISLCDHKRFSERNQVNRLLTNVELADNPVFMDHYLAALFLPHTDLHLFPTVARGKGQPTGLTENRDETTRDRPHGDE